jgi:hypothetical protein
MKETGNIFQEVDILQVIRKIGTLNKRTQAKILQRLEQSIEPGTEDYKELRKYILDELNGLTRGIVREIFGPIDHLVK